MRCLLTLLVASIVSCGGSRTPQSDRHSRAGVAEPPQSAGTVVLKALSFNLRHDRDHWEERFDLIAEQLSELAPHLIGAQEVEIGVDQTRALADRLASFEGSPKYYVFERLKHGPDKKRGEGIAIYSQFPFVETDWHKLSHGRIILFARVELQSGATLDVYNTHLHDKGGDALREKQVETLLAWIAEKSANQDVLVMGDFNAEPSSRPVQQMLTSLTDAHAQANPDQDGFTSPIVLSTDAPEQTLNRRIDFVFFRLSAPAWRLAKTETVMQRPAASGLMPSDHLGVLASFETLVGEPSRLIEQTD